MAQTGSKFAAAYTADRSAKATGPKAPPGGERTAEVLGKQSPMANSRFARQYQQGDRGRLPLPEKTWSDAWKEYDWKRSVPFVGSGVEAVDMYDLWSASRRLEDGTATKEDQERLTSFLDDAAREKSIGYMAASIVAELPAFIGEMAVGGIAFQKAALKGALGKGIREAVEATAAKAAKAAVVKSAEQGLLRRGAVVLARSAAQTAAMPQRIAAETYRRAMPEFGMSQEDGQRFAFALAGTSREFWQALPEGVADTFIEAFSEGTGGAISKLPPASWINAAQAAVARRWMTKAVARGVDPADALSAFTEKVLRLGQWDGVIAEMGEERVGDALRAAAGLQGWSEVIPDAKQLAAEFIAFNVPGAAQAGLRAVSGGEDQAAATAQPAAGEQRPPVVGTQGTRAATEPTTEADAKVWEGLKKKINTVRAARGDVGQLELSLFEPTSEGEKWASDIAARDGVKVYVFNGGRAAPAGYYRGRAIFLNASIPEESKKRWVAVHEMVHSLGDVDEKRLDALLTKLRTIDPKRFDQEIVTQVKERYRAGLGTMSDKVGREEGGANLAEKLGNLVMAMADNPAIAQEALRRAPSLGERIVDAIARFLNKLPGVSVRDSAYRRLARLRLQLGGDRAGIKDPRVAFAMAEAIRDAVVTASGSKPLPVDPTYSMVDDATTPQAIDVNVGGRRTRVRVKVRPDAGKFMVGDVQAADYQGGSLATPLELGIPRRRYESEAHARRDVFGAVARQFPLWDSRSPMAEERKQPKGPLLLTEGSRPQAAPAPEVDDEEVPAPPAPTPEASDFDTALDEVYGKQEQAPAGEGEQAAANLQRDLGHAFGPLPEGDSMPPSEWVTLAWTRLQSVPSEGGRRQIAPSIVAVENVMARINESVAKFGGDVKHERKVEPALKRGEHDRDTREWIVTTEKGGVYQFVFSLQMDGTFRLDYQKLGTVDAPKNPDDWAARNEEQKALREQDLQQTRTLYGDIAYLVRAAVGNGEVFFPNDGAASARALWTAIQGEGKVRLGLDKSEPLQRKTLEEAFESASVMLFGRYFPLRFSADQRWNWAVDFYAVMPRLSTRTGSSKLRQAYSTPMPLAYLAKKLALWDGKEQPKVYEPTAGNGMLVYGVGDANVQVNEIDPERARWLAYLFGPARVREGDALTSDEGRNADAILANPPFGTVHDDAGNVRTFEIAGFATTQIDQAIVLKSLADAKKDAVGLFIIGGHQDMRSEEGGRGTERESFYRTPQQIRFLRELYDTYNVVEHFTVDGKLYEKMGAAWPVDVILVRGRGASKMVRPFTKAPAVLKTWGELKEIYDGERSLVEPYREPQAPGGGENPGRKKRYQPRRVGPRDAPQGGGDGAPVAGPLGGGGATGGAAGAAEGQGGSAGVDPRAPAGGDGAGPGTGGVGVGRQPAASGGDVRPPEGGGAAEPGRLGVDGVDGVTSPLDVLVEPAPFTKDDFDKALDEVFGRQEPEKPEPPPKKPDPPPPAAEPGDAFDELGKAIDDLFSLNEQEESPFQFDESKYRTFVDKIRAAVDKLDAAFRSSVRDIVRGIVKLLAQRGFMREKVKAAQPYIERFAAQYLSEQEAASDAKQVPYRPKSRAMPAEALLPSNTAANVHAALDALEQRVGDVDEYVLREMGWPRDRIIGPKGVLTAEQVDALAHAIEKVKTGGAFVLGDQTGVGKGRVVAAMLVWAFKHGKIPVFVTEKKGLYRDMRRDLRNIGHREFTPFITNLGERIDPPEDEPPGDSSLETASLGAAPYADVMEGLINRQTLPPRFQVVFTTYDQMKRDSEKDAHGKKIAAIERERHQALRAIAPRALFVLDEAHTAGGQKEGQRKQRVKTDQASFFREVLAQSAGAFFASATWAKNPDVMSLYARTSMGRAFADSKEMVRSFAAGGVPLLQIVSTMLSAAGEYIRRERSYEGIKIEVQATEVDIPTANTAQEIMRRISKLDAALDEVRKAYGKHLKSTGQVTKLDGSVGLVGTNASFSSVMWNMHAQLLLALKVVPVADAMIAAHKRGEKPVVTLSHTMGSHLENFMESEGIAVGADVTDAYTFSFMFERYLQRIRQVTTKDHHGQNQYHDIPDEFLEAYGFLDEWKALVDFSRKSDFSKIPSSPIDYLIERLEAAGLRVGEITGRQKKLVAKVENGKRRVLIANRLATERVKAETIKWFNSPHGERTVDATGGEVFNRSKIIDALIINRSGAAGISLHASKDWGTKEEQRPRHMFIAQFEYDTNLVMQMLGRINRFGQVHDPLYTAVVSQLPTEKRPCAMLMNKLASLNANTNAARGGSMGLLDVVDFANVYGDQVVSQFLRDNPEYTAQFDLQSKLANANAEGTADGIAQTFTGRLVVLQVDEQERLLKQIEEEYLEILDQARARGENKLEAQVLELEAREVKRSTHMERVDDSGSPFAGPVEAVQYDVKRLVKPMTLEDVAREIREGTGAASDAEVSIKATQARKELARDVGVAKQAELDRLAEREATVGAELARALERVAAAKEKIATFKDGDEGYSEAAAALLKATARLDAVHEEQHLIAAKKQVANDTATRIHSLLLSYPPGTVVSLTPSHEGELGDMQIGQVVSVKRLGRAKSALASSDYVIRIATTEASAPVAFRFSQLGNVVKIGAKPADSFAPALRRAHGFGREQRWMLTGNIPRGFSEVRKFGRIVFFRDTEKKVIPGVLMPTNWDPLASKAATPVTMTAEEAWELAQRGDIHVGSFVSGGDRPVTDATGPVVVMPSSSRSGDIATPGIKGVLRNEVVKSHLDGGDWVRVPRSKLYAARFIEQDKAVHAVAAMKELQDELGLTWYVIRPDGKDWLARIRKAKNDTKDDDSRMSLSALEGDSAETWLAKQVTRWADAFAPVRRLYERLMRDGQGVAERDDANMAETLRRGRTRAQIDALEREYLQPILKAMRERGVPMEYVDNFLQARHAQERNATIQRRTTRVDAAGNVTNPDEIVYDGSGWTDQEAVDWLAKAQADEQRWAALQEIAKLFDGLNKSTRDTWVETGLESGSTVAELEAQWKFYAPLRTDMDKETRRLAQGFGVSIGGKEFVAATGRNSKADYTLAFGFAQAQTAIIRGEKNRVAQAFLRTVAKHLNPTVVRVHKRKMRRKLSKDGTVRWVPDPTFRLRPNVVEVKVGGKTRLMEFNPEYQSWATALKGSGSEYGGRITDLVRGFVRFLANLSTRWNPVFPLWNAVRDSGTAALHMAGEQGAAFAAATMRDNGKAFAAMRWAALHPGAKPRSNWDEWAQRYIAAGGPISGYYGGDVREIVGDVQARMAEPTGRRKALASVRRLLDWMGAHNDAVENASRLSFFVHAQIDLGWSEERAAIGAKELTVNFERRGELGAVMNAWWMFSNAGVQSMFRAGKALQHKGIRRLLLGLVVGAATWDLVARAMGGDDEDGIPFYDKIPDWEKRTNLILMLPGTNGDYVSLPAPFVYSFFQTIGQNLGSMASGHRGAAEASGSIGASLLDNFNPLGGAADPIEIIVPTPLDPIAQIVRNRDWAGRGIAPAQLPWGTPRPDAENFWPDVNPTVKAITSFMAELTGGDPVKPGFVDVSPETIEHLVGYYTGGLGKTLGRAFDATEKAVDPERDVEVRDIPLLQRLYRQISPRWTEQHFRENLEQVELAQRRVKALMARGERDAARAAAQEEVTWLRLARLVKDGEKRVRRLEATVRAGGPRSGLAEEAQNRIMRSVNSKVEQTLQGAGA